jgi:hypothetical protein
MLSGLGYSVFALRAVDIPQEYLHIAAVASGSEALFLPEQTPVLACVNDRGRY